MRWRGEPAAGAVGPRGVALAGMLLAALAAGESAGQPGGLFRAVAPAGVTVAGPPPSADSLTLRQRLVSIDFGQLAPPPDAVAATAMPAGALRLNLFDDASFTGLVERAAPTFSGGYSLSGQLAGVEMGTMTLVVNGDVVAGTVRTPRATYRIRPVRSGAHVIQQVDPSALPAGAESLPPRPPAAGRGALARARESVPTVGVNAARQRVFADDGTTIDVLVVYTPKARADAAGAAGIETLIDLYVAETNQAYADSGVQQHIRVVHTEVVNYTSDISSSVDLDRIADPNDGYMDDVHALRDTYGADLVHLISHAPLDPGVAYLMSEVSHEFESSAFSVTHSSAGPRAFAHELGHNMGLSHDRYQERGGREQVHDLSQAGPYPYSFGYVNQRAFDADAPWSARWRTIMAYPDQCVDAGFDTGLPGDGPNCRELLRFSNPNQTWDGDPLGVPGDAPSSSVTGPADAARSLNETRTTVAGFRPSTIRATASLSPDPSSVLLLSDGAWHSFTVHADEPVDVVANPGAVRARVQADGAGAATNACPAEPDDSVRRRDGETIHLAGCTAGTGVVRLVSATDQTVLRTYVFAINDHNAYGTERAALEAFYHSTGGPDWANSTNWLTDGPVATWHGVISDEAGRVTALDLQQNQMTGSIPPEIGNLGELRRLDFWANGLTGPIPAELGNLANLYRLDFTGNELTGSIPVELGNLTNLEHLSLTANQLTGTIPVELGNLVKVEWVGLSDNQLTGPIPTSIGDLLACRGRLDVSNNQLTGPVPAELGQLVNLTQLYLHGNPLTGPLPRTLMDLPNLDWLWFANTESVCAPADPQFQAWLSGFTGVHGPTCNENPTNRPPEPVGMLAPLTLQLRWAERVGVDVSGAFRDPDGDALTYAAVSSAPAVAALSWDERSTVVVTAVAEGTSEVTVTANDLATWSTSARQTFTVTVVRRPFTDQPIVPGETPVRAVHFTELRSRIDALRVRAGFGRFAWTDPVLRPGVTPVKLVHLLELRSALAEAYVAEGRSAPRWTDASPAAGTTPIRAAHVTELRAAVLALE